MVLLYDLVDEHDQLAQRCRRRGRHHSRRRFMQPETQEGPIIRQGREDSEGAENESVRWRVVYREWWGSWLWGRGESGGS